MKKRIESIEDVKHGSRVICPETTNDISFEVTSKTNFSINEDGFWMIDCNICGESHIIDYLFMRV